MSFNLIDKPWIPCLYIDGNAKSVSIQELFNEAEKIKDLNGDNPLVIGSLYRLLLAIIHRAINGPKDENTWMHLWNNDSFPHDILEIISSYLKKWHDRFFVFHEQRPFYQTPNLKENNKTKTTVAILAPQLASGGNRTLFDHSIDNKPHPVGIDQAMRWTIALQNFILGGTTTPYETVEGVISTKYAKAGSLSQAALVIIKGKSLYKTLILNLHQYNPTKNIPCIFTGDDKPVWERDEKTLPIERTPKGLVDWYTYQSRAIKIISPNEGDKLIREAIVMVGEKLSDKEHRKYFETMVAFGESSGNDPFPAVRFSSEKSIWRDLDTLLQLKDNTHRPKTLEWISDLIFNDHLKEDYFPLQLYGVCSTQASFIQFKEELLPFNPKRLHDLIFINNINEYLNYVEIIGNALWGAIRIYFIIRIPDIYQFLKSFSKVDNFFQIMQSPKIITEFWKKMKRKKKERIIQKINDSEALFNFWSQAKIIFDKFLMQNLDNPSLITLSDWYNENKELGIRIIKDYLSSNNFDAQALKAGTIAIKTYFRRLKK